MNDVSSSSNDTEEDSSKYRCGVDNVGEKTNMEERTKQIVIDGKRYTVARCDNNNEDEDEHAAHYVGAESLQEAGNIIMNGTTVHSTRMRRTVWHVIMEDSANN